MLPAGEQVQDCAGFCEAAENLGSLCLHWHLLWALLLTAQAGGTCGFSCTSCVSPAFEAPSWCLLGWDFDMELLWGLLPLGGLSPSQPGWNDLEEEEQPRVKLEQLLVVLSAHLPSPWLISF